MASSSSPQEIANYENSHSAVQSIFNSTRCYDLMQSSSKVRQLVIVTCISTCYIYSLVTCIAPCKSTQHKGKLRYSELIYHNIRQSFVSSVSYPTISIWFMSLGTINYISQPTVTSIFYGWYFSCVICPYFKLWTLWQGWFGSFW